jgi:hypothetical protein
MTINDTIAAVEHDLWLMGQSWSAAKIEAAKRRLGELRAERDAQFQFEIAVMSRFEARSRAQFKPQPTESNPLNLRPMAPDEYLVGREIWQQQPGRYRLDRPVDRIR